MELVDEGHARIRIVEPPPQAEPFQYFTGRGESGVEVYFANYWYLIDDQHAVLQTLAVAPDPAN